MSDDSIIHQSKWLADFRGDKAFLSNMYECDINYKGVVFKSVEHFFFYYRVKDLNVRKRILKADTPNKAKFIGKSVEPIDDWENKKIKIMLLALKLKFYQNEDLMIKLLKTGDDILEEGNTWGDTFWGVDYYTRDGKNILGKLLMIVRKKLNEEIDKGGNCR